MTTSMRIGKWTLLEEIGRGTFSTVFAAADDSNSSAALKLPATRGGSAQMRKEAKVMQVMSDCHRNFHSDVPKLIEFSTAPMFIAMEKVGKTLMDVKAERGELTLKTVATVAIECITALEELHNKGFVHVDVKPDNFAISLKESDSRVYLLDLGLCEKYMTADGQHVHYSEEDRFMGSPFFSSMWSLRGVKHSRRDDMESLGYLLLYLRKGNLPWFGEYATEEEAMDVIVKIRERTSLQAVCKDAESEFLCYLESCRQLRFDEKPDYEYLRSLFQQIALSRNFTIDGVYDWTPTSPSRRKSSKKERRSSLSTVRPQPIKVFLLPPATPGALIAALQQCQANTDDKATPLMPATKVPALNWPRPELVNAKRELLQNIA